MILRTLELKHFGRFAERSFEFRRGMNLVLGANEAGKSTLMEAIPAVLFGLRNKERFKPWGRQGSCEAALVFENAGRTVRIARDILADQVQFSEHDDLYHLLYQFEGKAAPQGRSSERGEYLKQLQRVFGMAEEEIFRASLFFGQGSLEISGQGLAGKIKAILSGFVEVDYDQVLKSLRDDYFAITRDNPWGKDKSRERELDAVRRRIDELEQRWFAAQSALRDRTALQAEMAELRQGIEADRIEHAKGERYLAWVRKQWHLEEKEEVLRKDFTRVHRQSEKVGELTKERQELEKALDQTGLPRAVPESLPLLLAEAEEIRRVLIPLQQEAAAIRRDLLAHANPSWRPAAALSALFCVIGLLLGWLRPGQPAAALTAAGLPIVVLWGVHLWRLAQKKRERDRIKEQGRLVETRREEAQARLAALDARFQSLGLSPSAVDIVRMQKNLSRHRQLAARLGEIDSALQVLEKEEELSGEKQQLTRQLAVLDERRERERPLQPNLLPPEALPEAEEKLAALGESLRERETALLELTRREAALHGELGRLTEIEEEGERLKECEERLARRKNALAVAFDLLAGSVDEFRRTYLEHFAAEIGQHLLMTSGGRYDSVRLEEDFSLRLKGKGGWRPAEHFSRGTVDGVYLAVRIALIRHLSQGRRLPLLLDDPLVNLDRQRLAETLKSLERLGTEHQVILFTHDEGLARRAARDRWHVLTLDDGRPGHSAKAEERSDDAQQLYLL